MSEIQTSASVTGPRVRSAPVPRRAKLSAHPVADAQSRTPAILLVLGLSSLLFVPSVGPICLLLSPVAAFWGRAHVRRERRAGREPSGMAVLGRNLGMLVVVPAGMLLAFAGLLMLAFGLDL